MKICLLNNEGMPFDTPPSYGGIQFVTHDLSNCLIKLGNEVHVLTRSKSGKNRVVTAPNGLITHYSNIAYKQYFYRKNKLDTARVLFSRPLYYFLVFNKLRKIQPDVVHVQSSNLSVPAYLLKIFYGTPYVVVKHNAGKYGLFGRPRISLLTKVWYKRPYIKQTDRFICLTSDEKAEFDELFGADSLVIPNGVDINLFHPPETKKETETINLLCVSRLVKGKGVEDIISALPEIVKKYPSVILDVVGDGELMGPLKALAENLGISNNIIFSGHKSHIFDNYHKSHIFDNYHKSHIFVMPSHAESFSLTILEAAASGLPIISTKVGVAPSFISTWNNGILIDSGNPQAIADAVIEMLDNPEKLETYRNNSLKSRDFISWDAVAEKFVTLYTDIIRKQEINDVA